jgi:hypothetical protein
LHLGTSADARKAVATLDASGLVVAATGYRARLPELVAEAGGRIELARSSAGLAVTPDAEVVDRGGHRVSNVLTYGLGVGIRAPDRIGGEPSNERAITSVWLYQHDVGRMVLHGLIGADGLR